MAEEIAVIDTGSASTTVDTTSTTVDSGTSGTVDTQSTVQTGQTVDTASTVDPNDPMAALEQAMDGLLPKDEPALPPAEAAAAVPEQFQAALEISPFVTSPETVQQAVRAADEVWKVATGQVPARQMLEGFKTANPQQYQAILQDLSQYIGEVTGQQVGGQAQPSPLDALKQSNPEAFQQIAQFYEQVMGKPMDGPADPREARLSALEQRYATEEQQRQQAQYQQQAQAANVKAQEFLTGKLKGTFGEGQEQHFIGMLAQKLGPEGVQRSMQEVLAGNTKSLEAAFKAVQREETVRLKAYNANLIKQHRTLASGVPAVPGSNAVRPPANDGMKALPGESTAQTVKRLLQG